MKLVTQNGNPYTDTAMFIHVVISCTFVGASFYVLFNFLSLNQIESSIFGVAAGVLFMAINGFLYHPISWLSKSISEYIIKPIKISYRADSVSLITIFGQVFMLRRDFGWNRTIYVDSWYSKDEKIVFYFIHGNCSEQFSITAEDLTNDVGDKVFGFKKGATGICDACNSESHLYYVHGRSRFSRGRLINDCNLCEDCLNEIIKEGLNNLDPDVYSDVVAESM